MGFSLSGGLSSMGKSIANTAGDMILSEQRAELDRQRLALAEQLAEGRETRRDERQSIINSKAAEADREFRSGEAAKGREHDLLRDTKREEGDTKRTILTNNRMLALHNSSEAAAERRFDAEMKQRVADAKERTRDKTQERILNSAVMASTETRMEPYITANGDEATRPVKVFNPEKAAGILRDAGHEDLAAPLFPKPKPENKAPAVPPAISGRVGLQWNPGKQMFRDAKGNLFDKNGKPVE